MQHKLLLVIVSTIILTAANAQISKVEHFFVSSPKAEELFNFFKSEFSLPVVWKFQTWGDFSSGGVTLGNVAFEFVNYKGVTNTKFGGIALEPKQSLEEFISQLDAAKIPHDTIQNNTHVNKDGVLVGWSTLGPDNLLPKEANLFICDYKQREMVFTNRKKASDSLEKRNGGALGLILLKEIVVGTTNFPLHKRNLTKLPGIKKKKQNVFAFQQGPSLRLKKSNNNGIEKIVMQVRSLASAKKYLESKKMLGQTTRNSIYISPAAIEGLQVELVE